MSTVTDSHPLRGYWASVAPYATPPIAATLAITPVLYGFVAKSAMQKEVEIPRFVWRELKDQKNVLSVSTLVKESCKSGALVGGQILLQNYVEKRLKEMFGAQGESENSHGFAVGSSLVSGCVSAPLLIAFNGVTMRMPSNEILKSMRRPDLIPVVAARESMFLFATKTSGPVTDHMKHTYGNTATVERSSSFVNGVALAAFSHPLDSVVTRLQAGMGMPKLRQLGYGFLPRAVSMGGFFVTYNEVKKRLEL